MDDFALQLAAFNAQIEQELQDGRLSFPTVLELSMRIKQLADDPNSSLKDIANAVRAEPVLSAKTLRMANTVQINPYPGQISTVNDAVVRVGLAALRCLAYAVAAEQLTRDHRSGRMRLIAAGLWLHSVDVGCWAYALAAQLKIANPDSALLAGLMRTIGQFYLLAKAADYPALERDMNRFAEFVATWNAPMSSAILETFSLPEHILDALDDTELYGDVWPPSDLSDVLFVAALAAETPNPFDTMLGVTRRPELLEACTGGLDRAQLDALIDAARATKQEMLAAVCN
ncbi:HDOD domain-containing protein [Thauera sinica]|uniref:HDOD domain-containing protein n=1 Tax=Thauera sinica TaxID=2665146 RepID=A0ABW1AW70_9RHOO|nr:HDOD domain-containing protein [Thauera sp. K11]ATE59903.1 histidine kinase [Thauera sp. K11]